MFCAEEKQIWKHRFKLITGGGMPLNMTLPNMVKTADILVRVDPLVSGVLILGFGDNNIMGCILGLRPNIKFVGGMEIGDYGKLSQSYTANMMNIAHKAQYQLEWNTDVCDLNDLTQYQHQGDLIAYSFDDSIPLPARRHWYQLIAADERVKVLCTSYHRSLKPPKSFVEVKKYRVRIEGVRCTRTQIVLVRS